MKKIATLSSADFEQSDSVSTSHTQPAPSLRSTQWKAAGFAALVAAVCWLLVAVIAGLAPFGEETLCTNDGYAQFMPFLSEFWSVMKEGGSLLYSFHGGLGGNFYLTMAYYLFSPFTFLVLLFDKAQIPVSANLIIILKNIFVIAVMAWYLPSRHPERKSGWLLPSALAIAYGFSYYFLGYAVNFMWIDTIALVPLMLYGLDRLDRPSGRTIYLVSLAIGILANFYMGAIVCIFLLLYWLVIKQGWRKRDWANAGWFAICSICAAACAGIVLIPVVQGMLMDNASRMSPPDFELFNNWQYFIGRLLPDAEIVRITSNRGAINLYMGTAMVFGVLLDLFTSSNSKRSRFGLLFLLLLYLAATQISTLNYAFHGFYLQRKVPNRFGFIIALCAVLMAYDAFSARNTPFWKTAVCGLSCAVVFALLPWLAQSNQLWLCAALPAVVLAILLARLAGQKVLFSLLILAESIAGLSMCAPGHLEETYTRMDRFIEIFRDNPQGRQDLIHPDISNSPLLYGATGLSAFNSVINPKAASFVGKMGYASGENYYLSYGWSPLSAGFFGIKTLVADAQDVLPAPYTKTGELEDLSIWTSPYDISFGIALADHEEAIESTNRFANMNALFPDCFTFLSVEAQPDTDSEVTVDGFNTFTLKDIKKDDENAFVFTGITASQVYLCGKLSGTKTFTVKKNDQVLLDNKYEGNVVYCGDLVPEDVLTVIYTADDDRDSASFNLYLAALDQNKLTESLQWMQDHSMKNQVIAGNVITGDYDSNIPEQMIFTLPYDAGWKAYVNDSPVEIRTWQNGLMAIDLPAGYSAIRLVYEPAGLKEGVELSLGGLGASVLVLGVPALFAWRKKKKNESENEE